MTCRHSAGDPACSSHRDNPNNPSNIAIRNERERIARREEEIASRTPDAENFEVLDDSTQGPHLVLKVQYPNCAKCSYEGTKVMVFLNCTLREVIKWRKIDPHFRKYNQVRNPREAPGPDARFPGSDEGWRDAIAYARAKANEKPGIRTVT